MKRLVCSIVSIVSPVLFAVFPAAVFAQTDLGIAAYTEAGELRYPANLVEWIQSGTTLGGRYNGEAFDPQNPGVLGVVQMEPAAYRYFLENGTYADGTMFLLNFYEAVSKSEPQMAGFVQGALMSQEIHVLDPGHAHELTVDNFEEIESSARGQCYGVTSRGNDEGVLFRYRDSLQDKSFRFLPFQCRVEQVLDIAFDDIGGVANGGDAG